jgi:16S rRNA (adenine1518-N6/adenine1519-N6)-dimethyltransferase
MNNPMSHRPRKRFGQNFLHDPGVISRIVSTINPQPGDRLVEIGPGKGAITVPLLRAAGRLQVVELDRDLVRPLQQRCRDIGDLEAINADALKTDFCGLAHGETLRLAGNLPYNISTPLLFHLLAQSSCIRDMHFMLQKEVVDRLAAAPGSGRYGRLSVMVQFRCAVTPLFGIGPDAFQPAPRVESAFVRLQPWHDPPVRVRDEVMLGRVVKQAFGQRRKTLRNALRGLLEEAQIRSLDIDPAARAEVLEIADFARLADLASGQAA